MTQIIERKLLETIQQYEQWREEQASRGPGKSER